MDVSYKTTCILIINLGFPEHALTCSGQAERQVGRWLGTAHSAWSEPGSGVCSATLLSEYISWCIGHAVGKYGLKG